jgi:hypothetical protein
VPGTLVIETTFWTHEGEVRVRDGMPFAMGHRDHDLGTKPRHEILRSGQGHRVDDALLLRGVENISAGSQAKLTPVTDTNLRSPAPIAQLDRATPS